MRTAMEPQWAMTENPQWLSILGERERALHRPYVRGSVTLLRHYLHPDFFEIGRSGRSYTLVDMLKAAEQPLSNIEIHVEAEHCLALSAASALLFYRSAQCRDGMLERWAARCSLWWLMPEGWQLRLHQAVSMESP